MEPSFKLNNGLSIPSIGLGTWQSNPGEVEAALKIALQAGYRHIDCATAYQNEAEIGQALSEYLASPGALKREEIFINSKLWPNCFSTVKESCQKTLKDLQLDYLDSYLIHWPLEIDPKLVTPADGVGLIGYSPERVNEVWRCMEQLVEEGLVKSIGISNFTAKKIQNLLASSPKIVPAINQVELHPYLPQKKLLEYCNEKGIILVAYAPLGSPARPDMLRRSDEPNLLEDENVVAISKKHNSTPAQVLFAWAIGRKTVVIPKSSNEKRIKENFACQNVKLDDEDMAKLNGIETRHRYFEPGFLVPPGEDFEFLWDGERLG